MHPITRQSKNVIGDQLDDKAVQLLISIVDQNRSRVQGADMEFLSQLKVVVGAFARLFQDAEPSVTFRSAAEFSMMARAHRRPSTRADLRSYINRMCLYRDMASTPIRLVTIAQCREMLQNCFGHSKHSYRKAQSVLHSIFNHAERQGWCASNPARAILRPPVSEKRVEILTILQIRSLLSACKTEKSLASMEPALRLMLWCGIRPMEVRRLRWEDIDPDEKMAYVEPVNSKTGGARAVPLRGGALALVKRARAETGIIAPVNWERLWRKLRHQAGFQTWQNDVLRHTFASMHLKRFHNLPLLQEEMGHRNATLLQTRYLNLRHLGKHTALYFFNPEKWIS